MREVTVYSIPGCKWCTEVKKYLSDKGIKFTDIDVSVDKKKAQYIIKTTNQTGVPVTIVNNDGDEKYMIGFDKKAIAEFLK